MPPVVPTVVRVAVILLAIAGTAGHVAYIDALWWHSLELTETVARNVSPALIMLLTAHAVVSVVCAIFAVALVIHEGPRQAAARGLGTAFGAWSYLMAYSGITLLFRPDPGPSRDLFEGHFLLIEMIGLAGLVRFTALFPQTLSPEAIMPPPSVPAVLEPLRRFTLWMLRPWAPWLVGLTALAVLWGLTLAGGRPVSDAGLSPLMDFVRLAAAGLVVLNLRRSWDLADEEGRNRLRWLLVALTFLLGVLAILIGGNVLVEITGFPEPDVAWRPLLLDVGLIGFLGSLALSVLYSGRVGPLTVVRKIASVSTVTTVGLFLAAALEALFSGGILAAFSLRAGVGSALALATILATYRGLLRFIDRLLPQA